MTNDVYMIKNKITGDRYIGKTIRTYQERYQEHIQAAYNNEDTILSENIREFGKNNFEVGPLATDIPTPEELAIVEEYYIDLYQTQYPQGLNNSPGGNETTNTSKTNDIDFNYSPPDISEEINETFKNLEL